MPYCFNLVFIGMTLHETKSVRENQQVSDRKVFDHRDFAAYITSIDQKSEELQQRTDLFDKDDIHSQDWPSWEIPARFQLISPKQALPDHDKARKLRIAAEQEADPRHARQLLDISARINPTRCWADCGRVDTAGFRPITSNARSKRAGARPGCWSHPNAFSNGIGKDGIASLPFDGSFGEELRELASLVAQSSGARSRGRCCST
jgi:hypothetical protein